MGIKFDALPEEAKRAAFAHMDARRKAAGLPRFRSGELNTAVADTAKSSGPSGKNSIGRKSLGSGQRQKSLVKTAGTPTAKQSPENPMPAERATSTMSYPELYHVATPERAEAIKREGFRNMVREDGGGKMFGPGTYLSLTKEDSDGVLRDMHESEYGNEIQFPVSANVNNPFKVHVDPVADRGSGELALVRTLRENGLMGPNEQFHEVVDTLDKRLIKANYDAIELTEDRYTMENMGSQLVVFDATVVKYGHDKPTEKPVQSKGRGLGSGQRHAKLTATRNRRAA